MKQPALLIFLCALLGSLLFILATVPHLPPLVASHFAADNLANGAMTRESYRNFMLLFAIVLPLFASLSLTWLPARHPRALNIPHRDYWLAPEQREATLAFLRAQGFRLGTLLTVFMSLVHFILIEANASTPPQLPALLFFTGLLVFLAGVVLWSYRLIRRFRRVAP